MRRAVRSLFCLCALVCAAGANTLVQIRTPAGEIDLELFDQDKPVTVRNFIRLIDAGAYRNSFFHRLETNFVLQGGGYSLYSNVFMNVPSFGSITNEFNAGPRLSNTFGTIAMAKSPGNPNSATCQFFLNLADNSANLDNQNGGFTVFGRVIRDGGLLPLFNTFSYSNHIVDLSALVHTSLTMFAKLPVGYTGWRAPLPGEFLYTDITLLRVAVTNVAEGVQISWNSPTGLTNLVEYTDGFAPPAWQELLATNGTGQRMSTLDTNPAPGRFYRIRVP